MTFPTFSIRIVLNGCLAILFFLAHAGCNQSETPEAVTLKSSSAIHKAADQKVNLASSKPTASKLPQKTETKSTAFKPPFPQRSNLFIPPKMKRQVIKSSSENLDDFQLQGFADVQGMRAVLVFGSKVKLLQEGEQHEGIRVIKIAPPKVTVQRGRVRWTIQLYDKED